MRMTYKCKTKKPKNRRRGIYKKVKPMLYIKTTMDDLELPIAVADSGVELAEMLNTTPDVVYSSISKKRRGWYKVQEEDSSESRVD